MSNPSRTTLSLHADEEGTYVITGSYFDENGDAVTPSSASWSLTDLQGTVINSRSDVAIASLATTFTIVLSGNDLLISGSVRTEKRRVVIEYVYDSSLGSGLVGRGEAQFTIDNYTTV